TENAARRTVGSWHPCRESAVRDTTQPRPGGAASRQDRPDLVPAPTAASNHQQSGIASAKNGPGTTDQTGRWWSTSYRLQPVILAKNRRRMPAHKPIPAAT